MLNNGKKSLIILIGLLLIFSYSFCFATNNEQPDIATKEIQVESFYSGLGIGGNGTVDDILETVRTVVLPIIPIFIVVGATIYFLTGVKSKEKRQKGIAIMIVGLVIYLVMQIIPLISELIRLNAFSGISTTTYNVVETILKQVQLISLPISVLFLIVGYTISNTIGARNMNKKRIGDTMFIGSIIFFVLINIVAILYPILFGGK